MIDLATTEYPVAKKSAKPPESPKDPSFERIEFQAPPGFLARIDRARKRRGLSRAAYIRQAVLLLAEQDEKESAG